jgi:hypothetical protein
MKLKIIGIHCIFLLGTCFLVADENSDFELLLQQEITLETTERIELLDKYVKAHVGQDSALVAVVMRQCVLIDSEVETSQIEKTLNDVIAVKPNGWEAFFAKYTLLNLMHVEGIDSEEKVIQLGEPMLRDGYFDVLDKGADPWLLLFKKYNPMFTSQVLKDGLIEQLIVAYEKLGNKTRVAELRKQLALLKANNNQQKKIATNQDDVSQAQPSLKSKNIQINEEQSAGEQRSTTWQLPLLIGALSLGLAAGVFWYFRSR